jgi:hypothetical protein
MISLLTPIYALSMVRCIMVIELVIGAKPAEAKDQAVQWP